MAQVGLGVGRSERAPGHARACLMGLRRAAARPGGAGGDRRRNPRGLRQRGRCPGTGEEAPARQGARLRGARRGRPPGAGRRALPVPGRHHAGRPVRVPCPIAHGDPFERMIAARSTLRALPVLTTDTLIAGLGAEVIRQARRPGPRRPSASSRRIHQVRRQPPFRLLQADPAAPRVVRHLVAQDAPDAEVGGPRGGRSRTRRPTPPAAWRSPRSAGWPAFSSARRSSSRSGFSLWSGQAG